MGRRLTATHCVNVICQKGTAHASDVDVDRDTQGQEAADGVGAHAGKICHGGTGAGEEHSTDDNIGAEREEAKCHVPNASESTVDDLEEGSAVRRVYFELGGVLGEEQDLHGSACSIPGVTHASQDHHCQAVVMPPLGSPVGSADSNLVGHG